MITVCIPSRTTELLTKVVTSLGTASLHDVEIVVADNGLERPLPKGIFAVAMPDPFVFSVAINRCAAVRDPGSHLLLLNDDTVVLTPDWARRMATILEQPDHKHYGILSPRVIGAVGNDDQRRKITAGEVYRTKRPICFLSALIRSETWEAVGPMDESFVDYGGEDVDYCRRATDAGWHLGVFGGVDVEHGIRGENGTTYRRTLGYEAWAAAGQRALRHFEKKWGRGPQLGAYEETP